jgi:hypothetical protein
MAHRINIMLDDEVWEQFQAIPGGERSRFVNEVVSLELLRRRQGEAWAGMQALRRTLPASPGHSEDWVREDRDAHA